MTKQGGGYRDLQGPLHLEAFLTSFSDRRIKSM